MIRQSVALAAVLFVLASCEGAQPTQPETVKPDVRVVQLVESISPDRLRRHVETLVKFRTRNTLSDTSSPDRGIGAARQWIFDELTRSSPRLDVSFDTYQLAPQRRITRPVELRNVIAILPGRSARRIYITAHYDTVNIGPGAQIEANTRPPGQVVPDPQENPQQDYNVDAPGADDNGSGTALTMELARVFANSGLDFDATVVFALWAGEEQGLYGARLHARRLQSEKVVVDGNFNNDIVGNPRSGNGDVDNTSVRVYAPGPEDSMSRSLARYIARVAGIYVPAHRVQLMAREDRFSRGSDHSAFVQRGFPAVVFRESKENFAKQHGAADTPDGVDYDYLAQNAKVNAAAAAALALAPPAPRVVNERGAATIGRQPSGYDANLRWSASPGAVDYRVYRRDPWAPDWQNSQLAGNVTQFVVPKRSIDDFVFGVAAVGANGHESLVSAYVVQTRNDPDVKMQVSSTRRLSTPRSPAATAARTP